MHRTIAALLFGILVASTPVQAQTYAVDRIRFNAGPCLLTSSDGTPDKLVIAQCPVLTTAPATNLTLQPTGDLVLGPTGADILPDAGYTQNLGALANKYLTLHAAELWVETLVAQNTIATIGGRVLVAPTTTLTADVTTGATSIAVKHNEMANGDRVYLEANGKVEFLAITSGPSGSGPYTYSVTRNLDGSGANDWYAGDAILNTGTTGDGFIDLYSVAGVLSGAGPTIVGNVRTGTTYSNIAPRWAIGNLNGLYGYGATTYGAAFGDPSATNVTVDATNGFRIRSGTTDKLVADTSGNLSMVGDLAVGVSGVVRSSTASGLNTGDGFYIQGGSSPAFRIGNPSGNRLVYEASTGALSIYGLPGSGRNMVRNSDCTVGTADWTSGTNTGLTVGLGFAAASYRLNDESNTCYLFTTGTPSVGQVSYAFPATGSKPYILAGSRYEASAYLGVNGTGDTVVAIQWLNSSGVFISQDNGNTCTTASPGGLTLASFCRSGVVATAPTGAALANVMILTTHTATLNPVVFFVHSYFGEAQPGQTALTPWGPGGLTEIIGGMIRTGTIVADNIAASTITGAKIAASTITADKLSVSTLSAIVANLGTVTAGSMSGVTATFGSAVTLNSSGITLTAGNSDVNKVKWSGGSTVYEYVGSLNLTSPGDINLIPSSGYINLGGTTTIAQSAWGGSGTRYICVDNSGVLFPQDAAC